MRKRISSICLHISCIFNLFGWKILNFWKIKKSENILKISKKISILKIWKTLKNISKSKIEPFFFRKSKFQLFFVLIEKNIFCQDLRKFYVDHSFMSILHIYCFALIPTSPHPAILHSNTVAQLFIYDDFCAHTTTTPFSWPNLESWYKKLTHEHPSILTNKGVSTPTPEII